MARGAGLAALVQARSEKWASWLFLRMVPSILPGSFRFSPRLSEKDVSTMKKLCSLAALAVLSMGHAASSQAADVTLAIGQSSESSMVYRLGTQFDFNSSWWQSDTGRLTGYWDAAYTYWD